MRTITEIDECNKTLNNFQSANGKIWSFDITHKRLVIRLWFWSEKEHKVQNEVFIAVLGCKYIRGAFDLKNVNMYIVKDTDPEFSEPRYLLKDYNSDFELIGDAGIGLLESIDS